MSLLTYRVRGEIIRPPLDSFEPGSRAVAQVRIQSCVGLNFVGWGDPIHVTGLEASAEMLVFTIQSLHELNDWLNTPEGNPHDRYAPPFDFSVGR
jgi:hypothetical protein